MQIGSIGIFLTPRCNFRCVYCCTETGADRPEKMTLDELQSVVRQAAELGARWVVVPGEGEPLLDENFFPLVDFAQGLGLRTKVYTNGALLDAGGVARLSAGRVSVVFKLHAFDQESYHSLAGIRSSRVPWEAYTGTCGGTVSLPRGLRLLLEAGYNQGPRVSSGESLLQIESVVVRPNLTALPKIARWCKSERIDFLVESLLPAGKAGKTEGLFVTPEEEQALFQELRAILGWKFGCSQRLRCRFETNPFVDSCGNLRHCFGLACNVGNIRETPLADLHERELELRKQIGLMNPAIKLGRAGFRRCATRRFVGESKLA